MPTSRALSDEPAVARAAAPSAVEGPGAPPWTPADTFVRRHLGPSEADVAAMLATLGLGSLEALVAETVPAAIRLGRPLRLDPPAGLEPGPRGEHETLAALRALAGRNRPARAFLGAGYHDTITPPPILRNVLENPGWYTQYTPYQAEIAQGRLEALLNFQTLVCDLTGLPVANASLLDEATAVAEAVTLCHAAQLAGGRRRGVLLARGCHPQTVGVVQTRAEPLGLAVHEGPLDAADPAAQDLFAVVVQHPATDGGLVDLEPVCARLRAAGARVIVAADPLALVLLRAPGACGADVVVGSTQRFGVPMGMGGPHAAYMAVRDELRRLLPGRIVGASKDARGRVAYRLALQTREQHIRREKATSNICTAQALLAIMASFYAVYHGPDGLRAIAGRVHGLARLLAAGLRRLGRAPRPGPFFDTVTVPVPAGEVTRVLEAARARGLALRGYPNGTPGGPAVGVSLDEPTTKDELRRVLEAFAGGPLPFAVDDLAADPRDELPAALLRAGELLAHPVFRSYHAEHELLRYMHRLQGRDLSLTHSMIPLGSCTMKLNATSEMLPVTWPELARVHPFLPRDQVDGYRALFAQLEAWLAEITGFAAVSLQPNAGAQGEYAGLLVIRAWQRDRGQAHRDVCLIPVSAHGTNPASAVMAGMRVVTVACDAQGNIDVADLRKKAAEHAEQLAALMVTYPSTHGVFEASIREVCEVVHAHGGQVYLDGANMNAQVGLCRPGDYGADVCHLNLHKTFCIPHGGGGPGMGPICVAPHLAPYLPGHPVTGADGAKAIGPVSAAAFGSPLILVIPWVYVALMGGEGLTRATQVAILNANYMAARLGAHYPVLYRGANGRVAHEFILDLRPFKASADVSVEDVAKRLMDYGFHAPTVSFPVPGTLMIEPTESESKAELDRLCDALIAIRGEIRAIEEGRLDRADNPLKHAPHTAEDVVRDDWPHAYGREQAAFPLPWVRARKFWPAVGRIDGVLGDRHLICTCPPITDYEAGA